VSHIGIITTMRANFKAGCCAVCGTEVAANEGYAAPGAGKNWDIKCKLCSGIADSKPFISISLEKEKIIIKPKSFLGGDLFSKYRLMTEGTRYDAARKAQVTTVDKLNFVLAKLQSSEDFVLDIADDVIALLNKHSIVTKESVEQAADRADKTDAILRERGLSLYPFQKLGVTWLASRTGALLADDMGLGKTIQTLIAIPAEPAVVVVAPAVAKGVWARECKKWRPEIKITVLSGKGSFRWPEKNEMIIINYDILTEVEEKPLAQTVLIADEAHNLKNSKAKRTVNFRHLSKVVTKSGGKVWLLTATPLLNRPIELWSIYSAANIAEEAFGSWFNFCSLFNAERNTWGGFVWGKPKTEVAERLRRVSLRRTKTEVLPDLPQKTWTEIGVDIDKSTIKLCEKFEKEIGFDKLAADVDDAIALLDKLNSSCFEQLSAIRAALAKAKIPALLEIIEDFEEQDEPVVVFSAHRAPIDFLQEKCGWTVITGDTTPEERTRIENDFQAGKIKKLAGTIKAMGVAITLTRASQAIFVDLEWTPALNSQAEDRLCRIGQTRGVCITTLVSSVNIDCQVIKLLSFKRELINATTEAAANVLPSEAVVIDFDAIAKAKNIESEKANEALKLASEREVQFAFDKEKIQANNVIVEKKLTAKALKDKIIKGARNKEDRRMAQTVSEMWAVSALNTLSESDPDKAREKNNVGFSAADVHDGHRYAVLTEIGLTDAEWKKAVTLCRKYKRQVGECPSES
jgi:SNF2 family DNA or RNA helicase